MDVREATEFLEINLLTESSVKNAYRRLVKQHHPDQGGNVEIFRQLQKVYEFAICHLVDIPDKENIKNKITSSGHRVEDLGKGFGSTTNGLTCDMCEGKGYRITKEPVTCPDCKGCGFVSDNTCPDCHGTGKFRQARSKRIVDCRRCGGTGKLENRFDGFRSIFESMFSRSSNSMRCRTCQGRGILPGNKILSYHTCFHCKGKGETKMKNPVIIKESILNY